MSLQSLLTEAYRTGSVTCPECGDKIKPDLNQCMCGWKNPLPEFRR